MYCKSYYVDDSDTREVHCNENCSKVEQCILRKLVQLCILGQNILKFESFSELISMPIDQIT